MTEIIRATGTSITAAQGIAPELFGRWISFVDAAPKTVQTYTRAIRQFAEWLTVQGITQPTRADILTYKQNLMEQHKPTTVSAYIVAVRLFFQWTAQENLYPNIAEHVKGAKLDREPKRTYLSADQANGVLDGISRDTLRGARDYAMVKLMMACGLRTIEVARADIGDMRLMGGESVLFLQGKGRDEKADYVKLPATVETSLRAYLKMRGERDEAAPLFAATSNNGNGQRMTTRSISGIAKDAMRAVGFDDSYHTAHSLRHTAVTLALIANGGNIQEAQQFARHSRADTTSIYAHNLDKLNNTCADKVAAMLH